MNPVVAVDWGGTWARAALVERGALLSEIFREQTRGTLGEQFAVVEDLVRRLSCQADGQIGGVGVAVCGIVQGGGFVASAGNIGMRGVDLRPELASRLGCQVLVVNDVQAAALVESSATPPGSTVVLLKVGTGVGGAIVDDGRLVLGRGAAGDFGHTPVVIGGPLCVCGAGDASNSWSPVAYWTTPLANSHPTRSPPYWPTWPCAGWSTRETLTPRRLGVTKKQWRLCTRRRSGSPPGSAPWQPRVIQM